MPTSIKKEVASQIQSVENEIKKIEKIKEEEGLQEI